MEEFSNLHCTMSVVDVPGQAELLMSNLLILSMIHGMFVCLVKLTDDEDTQYRQLKVWLSAANDCFEHLLRRTVRSHATRSGSDIVSRDDLLKQLRHVRLPVLVVGSHADEEQRLRGISSVEAKLSSISKNLAAMRRNVVYPRLYIQLKVVGVNATDPSSSEMKEIRTLIATICEGLVMTGAKYDWYPWLDDCYQAALKRAQTDDVLHLRRDTIYDTVSGVIQEIFENDDAVSSATVEVMHHLQVIGLLIAQDEDRKEEEALLVDVQRLSEIVSFVHRPLFAQDQKLDAPVAEHLDVHAWISKSELIGLMCDKLSVSAKVAGEALEVMMHSHMVVPLLQRFASFRSGNDAVLAIPALHIASVQNGFLSSIPQSGGELCHHRIIVSVAANRVDHRSYRNVLSRMYAKLYDEGCSQMDSDSKSASSLYQHLSTKYFLHEVRAEFSSKTSASVIDDATAHIWLRVLSNGLEGSEFALHFVYSKSAQLSCRVDDAKQYADASSLPRNSAIYAIVHKCLHILISSFESGCNLKLQQVQHCCSLNAWYQHTSSICVSSDAKVVDPELVTEMLRQVSTRHDVDRYRFTLLSATNYAYTLLDTNHTAMLESEFPKRPQAASGTVTGFTHPNRRRGQFGLRFDKSHFDDALEMFELVYQAFELVASATDAAGFRIFAKLGNHIIAKVPFVPNLFEFAEYILELRLRKRMNDNLCKTIASTCESIAIDIPVIRANYTSAMKQPGATVSYRVQLAAIELHVSKAFDILNTASSHLQSFFEKHAKHGSRGRFKRWYDALCDTVEAEDNAKELDGLYKAVQSVNISIGRALQTSSDVLAQSRQSSV
jgi:hypothetical protein